MPNSTLSVSSGSPGIRSSAQAHFPSTSSLSPSASSLLQFRVLDAASKTDASAWLDLWNACPSREIMAHPAYAGLFVRPGERLICVLGHFSTGSILFPLILRPLAQEVWAAPGECRWDATTPYGYGGPFSIGSSPLDAAPFWDAYTAWCSQNQVVSTFARLSLFPSQLAPLPGPVQFRLPNIVIPLAGGHDAIWNAYEGKVRKWVRVAQDSGVTVEEDRDGAHLDDFLHIYTRTMTRRHASDWYFFPRSFFQSIIENLAGHFCFFHARKDGVAISSDLVLCSDQHIYYFLGGTLEEAFPFGANYLLKHSIVCWGSAQGKSSCVLGGGYSLGDSLFRYKRAYARKGEVPFFTANIVHDQAGCAELDSIRSNFESNAGIPWQPRSDFFPSYRA